VLITTPAQFESQLRALIERDASREDALRRNIACVACERCDRCSESSFLRDCVGVASSTYCVRCTSCVDCSHCIDCTDCNRCSHCEFSERCVQSAYVIRSVGLIGCTYCFGCVGLTKKDFHILNEPYDRQTYFDTVAELQRILATSGHRSSR